MQLVEALQTKPCPPAPAAEASPPPVVSPLPGTEDATPLKAGTDVEEVLVVDARAHLTPAQVVERKLMSLLEGRPLPFSQMLLTAVPRHRGRP